MAPHIEPFKSEDALTQRTPTGGLGGEAFDDSFPDSSVLSRLQVVVKKASQQLNSIGFRLDDDTDFFYGEDGNHLLDSDEDDEDDEYQVQTFHFRRGERIALLEQTTAPWCGVPYITIVSRIRFATNLGRIFEAGRIGQDDVTHSIDVGTGKIVGVCGREGQVLDQLALIFRSKDNKNVAAVPYANVDIGNSCCNLCCLKTTTPAPSPPSTRYKVVNTTNQGVNPCHSAVITSQGNLDKFMMMYSFIKRDAPILARNSAYVLLHDNADKKELSFYLTPAMLASYLGYIDITKVLLEDTTGGQESAYVTMERAIANCVA